MRELLENPQVHRTALVLWIGFIFFSSTAVAGRWATDLYNAVFTGFDASGSTDTGFLAQKLFHVFLFVGLSWLLSSITVGKKARQILICGAWCLTIGILSEGIQLFTSTRAPSLLDVMLNGFSGALSSFLWVRSERRGGWISGRFTDQRRGSRRGSGGATS